MTASPKAEPTPTRPSLRPTLDVHRPLLAEAARAELDTKGLLIDLGTADQHKFTRGGWGTGWGENSAEAGVTFTRAEGGNTGLDVFLRSPAAELVLRARSAVAGQKVTLYLDGKAIATQPVPGAWGEVRIGLGGEPVAPGMHSVRLVFTAAGTPRAEVDWVWMASGAGDKTPLPVPRVMPLKIGAAPRRALVAPSDRTYSFYLQPPAKAQLVFDYASTVNTRFTVTITGQDGQSQKLFDEAATATWQEGAVDLAAYADKAVRIDLTTQGEDGVTGWGEPELLVAKGATAAAPVKGDAKAKNLIFLLVDTARADVFGPWRREHKVNTTSFDALAEKSLVFSNAYDNENWTKPSVASTLTGTYPSTHNTKTDSARLPDEIELAPERFKKEGFATAGFIANGYVSDKFGFQRGWDVYRNYIREQKSTDAEHVFGDALAWVKERKPDERFFLYVHTIDPHVPYRVDSKYIEPYFAEPATYKGKLGPTVDADDQIKMYKETSKYDDRDRAWLKAMYYAEVTYHDDHMGRFLTEIEKMGLMQNTVFVVTNDHGEELGDHEKYGHGHSLYDELLRAPLMIRFDPGITPGRWDDVVEHVDLMPTLADLLGVAPPKDADGASMLEMLRGEPHQHPGYALSEFGDARRAVRVGRWKLQRSTGTFHTLHDIIEDPGEMRDRFDDSPVPRRLCEIHMGEGLANPNKRTRLQDSASRKRFNAKQADIDPELRRQLEALGYFGGN